MIKYYLERQEYIEKNSKLRKNLSKKLDTYFFSYKKILNKFRNYLK